MQYLEAMLVAGSKIELVRHSLVMETEYFSEKID